MVKRKSHQQRMGTLTVFFEEAEEGGYVVSVPSLPGCHTEGDTFEEAERNVKEAIEAYFLALKDMKDPYPVVIRKTIVLQVPTHLPR